MNKDVVKIETEYYRVHEYLLGTFATYDFVKVDSGKPIEETMFRYYRRSDNNFQPFSRGGKTIVKVHLADGTIVRGVAICSMSDQFSYRKGRMLAIARALEKTK